LGCVKENNIAKDRSLVLQIQSTPDYPASDYPDFSIIRTNIKVPAASYLRNTNFLGLSGLGLSGLPDYPDAFLGTVVQSLPIIRTKDIVNILYIYIYVTKLLDTLYDLTRTT